jgi:hypothetical protein
MHQIRLMGPIMKRVLSAILLALPFAAAFAIQASSQDNTDGRAPTLGSISKDDGLAAWKRIEAVVTHPRCANCHVGSDNIPMWTIVGENESRPHGMNIDAGKSRIGTGRLACSTCHMTSAAPNEVPHAPPHAGREWRLADEEHAWFGETGAKICVQLRDRTSNGGFSNAADLIENHLRVDARQHGFIFWAWNPGGGRSTPPGTFEDHMNDIEKWGAAGQPCPQD